MKEHDLAHLETRIKHLHQSLTHLSDGGDIEELLTVIHRPGWTSVAEFAFVSGLVDTMTQHVELLNAHKQVLIKGSHAVGT